MEGEYMNSCLYRASVMHHRLAPKKHAFQYQVYMFYLDLAEIDALSQRLRWMSHNRFNLFNFRDNDHLQLPSGAPDTSLDTRAHIVEYLRMQGIDIRQGSIRILTNLCTLGYQFNPVSFYFCYDSRQQPVCAIAEVGNTFREMKPYLLGTGTRSGDSFRLRAEKYFYVSPFIDMDTSFDFDLGIPGERLSIRIDDHTKDGERFFTSTLKGRRVALNDANLLKYFLSFPFITLKIIAMIHWQAFRLWLKKIPYHKKDSHQDQQRDVYRPYK